MNALQFQPEITHQSAPMKQQQSLHNPRIALWTSVAYQQRLSINMIINRSLTFLVVDMVRLIYYVGCPY